MDVNKVVSDSKDAGGEKRKKWEIITMAREKGRKRTNGKKERWINNFGEQKRKE